MNRYSSQIEPCREDDEKAERDKEREKREEGKRLMVVPDSNDPQELSSWLQIINRALALANKSSFSLEFIVQLVREEFFELVG